MGFSFSRSSSASAWFRIGRIDVTSTLLLTGLCVVSMVLYAASPSFLQPLALIAVPGSVGVGGVQAGEVWRLVTWPFANTPDIYTALAVFFFFYFGREIERLLGRTRYLSFALLCTIIPAVIASVISLVAGQFFVEGGIQFLELAVIVAFLSANPGARTFYDIPLYVLVGALVGLSALQYVGNRDWEGFEFMALTLATGGIFATSFGIGRVAWIPRVPLPQFVTRQGPSPQAKREERRRRQAAHLTVVQGQDMDSLLDKIAERGIDSLSPAERRRLDEHSTRERDERDTPR